MSVSEKPQDNYSLHEIVMRINGGDFIPHGETRYDEKAYVRQTEIEDLIDWLLYGMRYVYEFRNRAEYSYQKAGNEAKRYFMSLRDTIDDLLGDE